MHAVRSDGETHAIDAVVKAIEPDAEDVRVAITIPLDELMKDAVWGGVPQAGTDVEGPIVVGEADLRLLLGQGKGDRPQFTELGFGGDGGPAFVVQPSINLNGAELHPDGFGLRFPGEALRPSLRDALRRKAEPREEQDEPCTKGAEREGATVHRPAKLHCGRPLCSVSGRRLGDRGPCGSDARCARARGWSVQRHGNR